METPPVDDTTVPTARLVDKLASPPTLSGHMVEERQ